MNRQPRQEKLSEMQVMVYRVTVVGGLLLFLAAVLALPSYFETMTLWYKTGIDKKMLIGGQHVGLIALVLLYLQVVLANRGQFLEAVFGPVNLIRYHKINALLLVFLTACHILLVLIPEGLSNLPIGKKFWPEMIGALLFFIILILVATSYFRRHLHLPFGIWRSLHKPAGYLVVVLVTVHVLFVSESFERNIPRFLLLSFFALLFLWTIRVKYQKRHKSGQQKQNNRRTL